MFTIRKSVFMSLSGIIFLTGALVHGFRAFYEWEFIIGGWMVPIWVSWLASLVAFLMALTAVRLMK